MSFFIVMPIEAQSNPNYDYDMFKTAYLIRTTLDGNLENVPSKPQTNEQETHYIFETSRLTQEGADALESDFPMVKIRKDFLPSGHVIKIHPGNM